MFPSRRAAADCMVEHGMTKTGLRLLLSVWWGPTGGTWLIGTVGGIRIPTSEVKILGLLEDERLRKRFAKDVSR